MLKKITALFILAICSSATHAAFVTINNYTGKSFNIDSAGCFPIKPSSFKQKVPILSDSNLYTNSNCQGLPVAKILFNDKDGIKSVIRYSTSFVFTGKGFELTINNY